MFKFKYIIGMSNVIRFYWGKLFWMVIIVFYVCSISLCEIRICCFGRWLMLIF